MLRKSTVPAAIVAVVLAVLPNSANAFEGELFELEVCNQAGFPAAVALSYQREEEYGTDLWFYEGWLVIPHGECSVVAYTPNRYFYVFATRHDDPDLRWEGDFTLCVEYPGPYEFVVHNEAECPPGSDVEPFTQYFIDHEYSGFTVTLE